LSQVLQLAPASRQISSGSCIRIRVAARNLTLAPW